MICKYVYIYIYVDTNLFVYVYVCLYCICIYIYIKIFNDTHTHTSPNEICMIPIPSGVSTSFVPSSPQRTLETIDVDLRLSSGVRGLEGQPWGSESQHGAAHVGQTEFY